MDSGSGSKHRGPDPENPPPGVAPGAREPGPARPPPTEPAAVDAALARLSAAAPRLARLGAPERAALLRDAARRFHEVGSRIIALDAKAKGIPNDGPLSGEPALDGPVIVVRYAVELARTLEGRGDIGAGDARLEGGRTVVDVLPRDAYEAVVAPRWSATALLDREVDPKEVTLAPRDVPSSTSAVALVLGAGNVTSIGVVDALQQIFVHGRACVYKASPANDYLGPLLELAFAPLVKRGFLAFVYGGRELGELLVAHPAVDVVHVTGAYETHEAIVWGPTKGRAARKAARDPLLKKPVTSELGNVSPALVVPGHYTD